MTDSLQIKIAIKSHEAAGGQWGAKQALQRLKETIAGRRTWDASAWIRRNLALCRASKDLLQ